MALVEVPDGRGEAQCAQRPDSADAQHHLLVEPHLPSADVQDVGDMAIRVVVAGVVRVEQEHGHAAHLEKPDRREDHPAGQLDRDRQRVAHVVQHALEGEAPQVEVGILVLLVPIGVDRLAEEPAAVEETHPDHRERHVAGGLHVVAGEHAEPAGVDAQGLVEAILGAEIGDRPGQPAGVVPVEPVVGPVREIVLERLHHAVVFGDEGRVVQERLPVDAALEQGDRVPVARPDVRLETAEEQRRSRVPHPPEVVGERAQAIELWWDADRDRGLGRDTDKGNHLRRDHTGGWCGA